MLKKFVKKINLFMNEFFIRVSDYMLSELIRIHLFNFLFNLIIQRNLYDF